MRTIQALVAIAAIVAGSLVIAVPTASANGPSITVTPSTGLIEGQTVTVSGTGFTVGTPTILFLDECANVASPVLGDCSANDLAISITSIDNFVATYTVARFITTTNEGSLDCAVPNACVLDAVAGYIGYQQATAPITFGSTLPNFRILNPRMSRVGSNRGSRSSSGCELSTTVRLRRTGASANRATPVSPQCARRVLAGPPRGHRGATTRQPSEVSDSPPLRSLGWRPHPGSREPRRPLSARWISISPVRHRPPTCARWSPPPSTRRGSRPKSRRFTGTQDRTPLPPPSDECRVRGVMRSRRSLKRVPSCSSDRE